MSAAPARLTVCLLASEVAPLSKTGGLADVAHALGKYLHADGHDVRLFTPLYASIERAPLALRPVPGLQQVPLAVGVQRLVFSVFEAALPGAGGLPVLLIDCPELYARASLYTADPDEHVRFIAFTRAVFVSCTLMKWPVQVFHCNDWHSAFGPLLLRTEYGRAGPLAAAHTLLTIHNIGYQGIFPAADIADLGLSAGDESLLHQGDLAAGRINALRHGILYADALTTVSPTHAREICTEQYGMGLEDSLRARGAALSGILNGVDYDEWDPRRDRFLPVHYDREHLAGKAELKRRLLASRRLGSAPGVPLAGIVSRLAAQKGIELMFEALPKMLESRPLTVAALGSGEPQYERFFADLALSFPERVTFEAGYDEELSHWIEAASDLFLMPSRYEPCGLNQMYSLRYGTVPIVRRTGGLADSVEHYDTASGRGTGVVFNDFDAPALEWALGFALDLYDQPVHWSRMMRNGMSRDFSWQRAVAEYLGIYRQIVPA
ncbi:MAG TPA: glycogen synthase [Steroidobacteraceae bacterium]|nr:glycogen synthase [Steroidobacteraceae bacterium]